MTPSTSEAAQRPALRFHVIQRAALFLAAAAAFAGAAVGEQLPLPAMIGFGTAWIVGFFVRERPWRTFAVAVNAATILGVPLVLMLSRGDRSRLPIAAAEAALIVCANRLLVRRTPGDDGMLHLACWLVLASGAALTGEMLYGIALVAYAVLASISMLLSELRRGIEEEAERQASTLLAAPELTSRSLLGFAAGLGLFSAAFATLVFPIFPRARVGMFQAGSGGTPVTGLTDHVDLSASGRIGDSARLVLRAELDGDLRAARYWRAVTLETFTGRGWIPAASHGSLVRSVHSRPGERSLGGTFDFFPDSSGLLPVPEGLSSLWPIGPNALLMQSRDGDLRLAEPGSGTRHFRFEAGVANRNAAPDSQTSPQSLQLPSLSPETSALARRLVPDGASPSDAIAAVVGYLSTFTYSRNLHATESPLDDFLGRRSGHCELFATAAAVLLRARGIPARYVGGYYGDPTADGLTLRDWDAHAWAEAWVPGKGFVVVDATPPDLRGPGLDHTKLWQRAVDLWDSARLRWLHGVIDFDMNTQQQTAGWLIRHLRHPTWPFSLPRTRHRTALLSGVVLLLVAALVALRRQRRPEVALRLEAALFRRLASRGVARGLSETHEEILARLSSEHAQLAEEVGPLLGRIAAARFGARPIDVPEARALRARIRKLGGTGGRADQGMDARRISS